MKTKRKATASLALTLSNENVAETPPSRRTRSQSVPDWSVEESLVLVSEIASLDQDWLKALSSYQKWKMISDSCTTMRVSRSSTQCKRRWESLLSDYEAVVAWESSHGRGSYWTLNASARLQRRLPVSFDHQIFSSIDALLNAQDEEVQSSEEAQSSEEDPGNMLVCVSDSKMPDANVYAALGSGETDNKTMESKERGLQIVINLQEKTEQTPMIQSMENVLETPTIQSMENVPETPTIRIQSMENVLETPTIHIQSMENALETPTIQSMENALETPTIQSMENVLEKPTIQSMGNVEIANKVEENMKQKEAIESMNNSIEIANKVEDEIQENAENMESAIPMANKQHDQPQENMQQIHMDIMDTKMEKVNLMEDKIEHIHATEIMDMEQQMHVTEIMDIESEMTNKLQGNELKERVDQIHIAEIMKNALEVQITKNTDNAFEMVNKMQDDVEQNHNLSREIVEKTNTSEPTANVLEMEMENKLLENTEHIHVIENLNYAHEMIDKLQEDKEDIHATETMDALDTINIHGNVKSMHTTENSDNVVDAVEMTNKVQIHVPVIEDVEDIHVSENLKNTVEMVNILQKNIPESVPLIENVEHNINQTHSLSKENVGQIHITKSSMSNAYVMVNRTQENIERVHLVNNTDKTLKMASRLQGNGEQIRANKSAEQTMKRAQNLQENLKNIHAIKISSKALKMANKLQMNAEQIHAVLRGDVHEYVKRDHSSTVDLSKPNAAETDFTRRRADELIKAFGILVDNLDQFTDLIKDGRCEVIRDVNSLQFTH